MSLCDDCDMEFCECHMFETPEEQKAREISNMLEDREYEFPCDYEKDRWLRGVPVEQLPIV